MTANHTQRRTSLFAVPAVLIAAIAMTATTGCGTLAALLGLNLNTVRVELVNNGDYDVKVLLFTHTDQNAPEDVIKTIGEDEEFLIPPGERVVFLRDCDDIQAIVIDEAELMVIGDVGPKTDTGVLRDGSDYQCGNAIIFTFDHSNQITDFDVMTSVEDR